MTSCNNSNGTPKGQEETTPPTENAGNQLQELPPTTNQRPSSSAKPNLQELIINDGLRRDYIPQLPPCILRELDRYQHLNNMERIDLALKIINGDDDDLSPRSNHHQHFEEDNSLFLRQ